MRTPINPGTTQALRGLRSLALAAITVTLLAPDDARAEIVYSGANRNVTYTNEDNPGNPGVFSLFNEPGNWDDIYMQVSVREPDAFNTVLEVDFSNLAGVHGNLVQFAIPVFDSFEDVLRLNAGDVVDGARFFNNDYQRFSFYLEDTDPMSSFSFTEGNFLNASGYVGIRMVDGPNTYYGWIQLAVTNSTNANIQAVLIDWAYNNTPGEPIAAGDTFTPDPNTVLLIKGGAVPGVAEKTFTGFGTPAINGSGTVAVVGKWSGGAGIFVDGALVVATGQVISGTAAVKSLRDPVIDDTGHIALPCVLTGAGITSANDAAILSNAPGGSLAIVAQEGAEPAGVAGAKWKAFQSVAAPGGGGGVIILGTMLQGTGGIISTNDSGLWSADAAGALHLVLREGTTQIGAKTVKSFTVLRAVSGSPGQTHAFNGQSELVSKVTFTTGEQAIVHTELP